MHAPLTTRVRRRVLTAMGAAALGATALAASAAGSAGAAATAGAPSADTPSTAAATAKPAKPAKAKPAILIYSKTAGFRHISIEQGVDKIRTIAKAGGYRVVASEDETKFNDETLAKFDAVVFVSTTGDVLPEQSQRDALETFIQAGGGWAGVHAASDMGPLAEEWPWYHDLVGGAFKGHTAAHIWETEEEAPPYAEYFPDYGIWLASFTPARVLVEDQDAAPMHGWGEIELRDDEWYGFIDNPRDLGVHVLATVDEYSYDPHEGEMGTDHPIAWCQRYDGGKVFYSAMGHQAAAWDKQFMKHVFAGIEMVAGETKFTSCNA